ncbi:serine O-acetyltransferase [Neomegalonema perideroedes]|uniref:serine O-acetyltransferase n=1 Tax=Neomegalonema perideroedes TaxID=217219 RepID=UPI00037A1FC5|nr:serine O-acetyltransferase [Neomegalonema perideroedes]
MNTISLRAGGLLTGARDPAEVFWADLRAEAEAAARAEPLMAAALHGAILAHASLSEALIHRIAGKLAAPELPALALAEIAATAHRADPGLATAAREDVLAVKARDPACERLFQPLMYFKGYLALQSHRIAHWHWRQGAREAARFLQMRQSEVFGVDIHPAARIGRRVMFDHATGVVIGETAVIGDDVSILHGVTLGGTGKETGDRHPKIGSGVMIGAGASVLGNIRIGECSRIGAGSVVLADVPPRKSVVGAPARIVGDAGCDCPAKQMDQRFAFQGEGI